MYTKSTWCLVSGRRSASLVFSMADDEGEWASRYDRESQPFLAEDKNSAAQRQQHATDNPEGHRIGSADDHHQPAVLGDTCAICLHPLADPAMVRPCHHVYCFECITTWVQNLSLHGVATPTCPLCKTQFQTVYTDVQSEHDYTLFHFAGDDAQAQRQQIQQQHQSDQRRSIVYRRRMRLARIAGVSVSDDFLPMVKVKGEYEGWIKRELRACIGRDIDLTVLLVLINLWVDKMQGRRAKTEADGYQELRATLEPFLHDDAELFVCELACFLGSRLNMDAYDEAVEYRCSDSSSCTAALCSKDQN